MEDNYRRYGGSRAAVVLMPGICHARFVFWSVQNTSGGWAIRDFITNNCLENERSDQSWEQIENHIQYREYPPFYNVTNPQHFRWWEAYLIMRTIAYFRQHNQAYDMHPPRSEFGQWMHIASNWQPVQLG